MAFAASGAFLLPVPEQRLLSDSLTGDDGWFVPGAPADTWHTAQMAK